MHTQNLAPTPAKKLALVLGGGGSKGAYQVGAYRALRELGLSFDLVTGVSIGALNGAMIVQGDFDKASALWENLAIDQVIDKGLNLTTDIDYYFNNVQKLLPFLKSYTQNKGMDTAPLWEIITTHLDYAKLSSSAMDFGLLCVEVPSFQACEQTKATLSKQSLAHWVMASASCFPAFPIYNINGKSYIDGGYYDNLPIDLAFKMGASEVIAISLHNDFVTKYDSNPLVRHIRPSRYLGTMLDFSQDSIARNIKLGYLDTKRYFGKLAGLRFAFMPLDEVDSSTFRALSRRLLASLLAKELDKNAPSSSTLARFGTQLASTGIISKITSTTPFCDMLLSTLKPYNATHISLEQLTLALLESYMQLMNYDEAKTYNALEVFAKAKRDLAYIAQATAPISRLDSSLDSSVGQEIARAYALLQDKKPETSLFDEFGEKLLCAMLAFALGYEEGARI
ncbi:patatin-like phospholipase family protein [Helicobacter zhangjianzhongii]|uniref:patatin-like phospholipase family protein n=1 Tax=Helicobacter zhangjianzhongii TaxID=2974574 RepID=UPI002554AF08|nr:patatin-like phospholipase family protein [Helicobacter sp. CPD2-1]MDL0079236.1 patatin-like phospholipase family protein [Helicobacter sp. CPD2-1]